MKRPSMSTPSWWPTVKTTIAAVVLALLIGAVLIALSDQKTLTSGKYIFSYPWDFFSNGWHAITTSYWALLKGSFGSTDALGTVLVRSAPLICAGLGVTLAFRAGLFNIGAQGQLICPPGCTCSWPSSQVSSAARCGASSPAS